MTRRSTGLPTLVVICRPCHDAGKGTKLAEFDLGPDGPSQTHHTLGQWSDDDAELSLRCPRCKHRPQPVTQEHIAKALAAVAGKLTIYL
ncbi:MAG: hypothetical protein WBH47_14005 [Streptosporangiaceae bacterium]